MSAFCSGFSQHEAAISEIARTQVFSDPEGQDKESLEYAIDNCTYWIESIAKQPIVSASERVKICGLLTSALRAVKCFVAEGEEKTQKVADEILSIHIICGLTLSTGYLANHLTMDLSEERGVPTSLFAFITSLLASSTATKVFSLSSPFPYLTQRTSRQISSLIKYLIFRTSNKGDVVDITSAQAFYNAPADLSCLSFLARRQRYRSASSSSEEGETPLDETTRKARKEGAGEWKRMIKGATSTRSTRQPRPVSRQETTVIRPSPPQITKPKWRGKCPRNSDRPCRGRWYSQKTRKIESCVYGCMPINQ